MTFARSGVTRSPASRTGSLCWGRGSTRLQLASLSHCAFGLGEGIPRWSLECKSPRGGPRAVFSEGFPPPVHLSKLRTRLGLGVIPRDRPGAPLRPEREGGGAVAPAPGLPGDLGRSTRALSGSSGPLGMDIPEPGSNLLARRGPRASRQSGLRSQESEPGPTRKISRPRTFHRGDSLYLQTLNFEPCETQRPQGGEGRAAGARPPPRRPALPQFRAPGWGTPRAGLARICE